MWPGEYWRLYTDAIVHTIHRRVFEHVKHLSEAEMERCTRLCSTPPHPGVARKSAQVFENR